MLATNGKGVGVVVNSLSGNWFYASIQTLSARGHFFHLTKVDMKQKKKLGNAIMLLIITCLICFV